jgi:LacI family repressor for deo operon, udp, cdd, tsx, nupC, and nupG
MKQPRSKIGEAAMDLLLTVVEGDAVEKREVLLRSELILRNSVARPEAGERGPGQPKMRRS